MQKKTMYLVLVTHLAIVFASCIGGLPTNKTVLSQDLIIEGSTVLGFDTTDVYPDGHQIILLDESQLVLDGQIFLGRGQIVAEGNSRIHLVSFNWTGQELGTIILRGNASMIVEDSNLGYTRIDAAGAIPLGFRNTIASGEMVVDTDEDIEIVDGSISVKTINGKHINITDANINGYRKGRMSSGSLVITGEEIHLTSSVMKCAGAHLEPAASLRLESDNLVIEETNMRSQILYMRAHDTVIVNGSGIRISADYPDAFIKGSVIRIHNSEIITSGRGYSPLDFYSDEVTISDSVIQAGSKGPLKITSDKILFENSLLGKSSTDPDWGVTVECSTHPTIIDSTLALQVSERSVKKMGLDVEWKFNVNDQFPGKIFGDGWNGLPVVWDIDSDGINEVLWSTWLGDSPRVWCIEGNGSFEWIYPPIDEDGLTVKTKISIVDVDNDGRYELAFIADWKLHVLRSNGSLLWVWGFDDQALDGAPQAYDVDGDGFVEFFVRSGAGYVYRVDHRGELVWASPKYETGFIGELVICDIDQNGGCEVLWNLHESSMFCISADTGDLNWRTEGNFNGFSLILDVDSDNRYEIIAWTSAPDVAIVMLDDSGSEISRWTHPAEGSIVRRCHPLGDLNRDGRIDLVFTTYDKVYILNLVGERPTVVWEANFSQWSIEGKLPEGAHNIDSGSYQLIVDIDGDNEQEVLWLAPYPIVTDAATGALEGFWCNEDSYDPVSSHASGGWWGDVDNDGISEWIVELEGYRYPETEIYCFTMNGSFPSDAFWPEYDHSAYPGEYQDKQDWLLLKGAYSNSLWFPIQEIWSLASLLVLAITLRRWEPAADPAPDQCQTCPSSPR